jgi:hypothetical protein
MEEMHSHLLGDVSSLAGAGSEVRRVVEPLGSIGDPLGIFRVVIHLSRIIETLGCLFGVDTPGMDSLGPLRTF